MIKFSVRLFFFLTVLIAPQFVMAQGTEFQPLSTEEVSMSSRTVMTTILPQYFISHFETREEVQRRFVGLARRDRNLARGQVRSLARMKNYTPPRRVVASRNRIQKPNVKPMTAHRPSIRGKNISIIRMRVGGRTVAMDEYVQGTRENFDIQVVEKMVDQKVVRRNKQLKRYSFTPRHSLRTVRL